jgi:hypothetical protein
MRSASASNSPGVTVTSWTQATTPNVPTPPKHLPLLGQIFGLTHFCLPPQTGQEVKLLSRERNASYRRTAGCRDLDGGRTLDSVKSED